MVYVWCTQVGWNGEVIGARCRTVEGWVFSEALQLRLALGIGSSSMFRVTVYDAVGYFDESLLICEDLDFICRFSKHYSMVNIPKTLARLHMGHPRTTTPTKKNLIERRDYIIRHQAKFSEDLAERRGVRASLWRTLAKAELRIRNYGGALRAIIAAFVTHPISAYLVAKWLARTAFGKIWQSN